ncbi:hypothetical protein BDQ12DRAFT_685110, partial [Crucibulum laeve]
FGPTKTPGHTALATVRMRHGWFSVLVLEGARRCLNPSLRYVFPPQILRPVLATSGLCSWS